MTEVRLFNAAYNTDRGEPSRQLRDRQQQVEKVAAEITQLESCHSDMITTADIQRIRSTLDHLEQSACPAFGYGEDVQQFKLDSMLFDNLNARLDVLESKVASSQRTASAPSASLIFGQRNWTMV